MPKSDGQFKKGNQLGVRPRGPHRADMTTELITQLNEILADKHYIEQRKANRTKLSRVVKNLIDQATIAGEERDEQGKLIKEGKGDLGAILAIYDRLEGRPAQRHEVNTHTPFRYCAGRFGRAGDGR
jgi:hypothetical protein